MKIFPAIDLYGGCAVRLFKGDYDKMTVYSDDPVGVALDFKACGAGHIHTVDLEGAKDGTTPNLAVVADIVKRTGLFVEIGGGIRSLEALEKYFSVGVSRAILGTAAVTDTAFLAEAVRLYGDKIAVGADVKDGYIAIKGWLEQSDYTLDAFFKRMTELGVGTLICTDISRDGAMRGTNLEMYKRLSAEYSVDIVASGGVSSIDDVRALSKLGIYGAIIGKAYYTGAIDLKEAVSIADDN